ncbi:adhesion G protein-coupled receptor A2 isoform X2 [Entelurus aequoreus]|uniref:adhesion G protein-coupled receptor A2 isoform X2 n=1 Tax=Entelurus aequoreus TaxID=161455 RepID=UPI002B1CEE98|nr:adhesion G protein-coupled receptor A2 isoform X2 [Entelurus aequoreus]
MRVLLVLCALVALWGSGGANRNCPDLILDSCHCSAERSKELSRQQQVRVKVVCDDVDLLETLHPSFLPNRTISLTLSNNKISMLRNGSFYGLAALEKLDLRNNLISTVEPWAFRGLLALRRLDLSNNRIGCLSPEMFLDLGSLLKLNLSGNIFSTLTVGLFTQLIVLRVLHFSTETLFCDCQLKWLLLWAQSNSVRIGNDTMCMFPTHLHGLEFRNLREQQLTCDGTLEMPLFQLIPSQRQLVFQGDRLPLQCTATYLDPSIQLQWHHNGHIVTTQEDRGVYVEETLLHDCCLLTSEVILANMDVGLAGTWECLVTSSRGNRSQQMDIVVLETSAPYCPADRVINNKGEFRWPKTFAGILAFLPCAPATFGSASHPSGSAPRFSSHRVKKAWRRCNRTGRWDAEDYTQCPYASELTRVLHELTQITINSTNAQPLGQQLVAFTSRAAHFSDVMDVIFVTHLVERLTRLVEKRKELGDYISDIASNMMLVEEHILWMAQNEARACTRIVQCVERIGDLALSRDNRAISKVSANIALEAFLIRPSNFLGLSCTALQEPPLSALLDSHTLKEKDTRRGHDTMGESFLNFKCDTLNRGSPASQLSKVGVVLHYSSLATMLWLGVTARNIYKQVVKKPPQSQDGDPPRPPKQPLLRFYLVSGGVPLIICGVTAAVNIDNYGSGEQALYCWMAWEPSLGAFFGPVALIVLVTCIYFLCTFIQLRRHPEKKYELKQLTEEQQRLASIDVPTHCQQAAEPGTMTAQPTGSHCPAGCPGVPINPALLANEHSFKAQLRTAAFTLFLFLATWTFGALAVSQGHFLDMIFSCLYGAFSVTLGLFILIHHCAKRDDVWHCWCSCCPGRRANACPGAHGQGKLPPKVNVNGDTPAHGYGHSHCHHDSPCEAVMSCSVSHCKHAALASSQNHVTCLAPVTPCCAALHSQQLMEEEPTATHVLLHADPEGYRPGIQLHPCLKTSTRTKGRQFSRRSATSVCGATSEREYAYHIPSNVDGGSVHSSHTDSPHSSHERHTHTCPHLVHEGHHTCHAAAATAHEALACHNPCHRHVCCAKADLFPSLCPAEAADAGVFLCGCSKAAEEEPIPHPHMEMHGPRRQSYAQNPPNQNGILKGGVNEGLLYASDSTGNIRTGPWKNETTV